MFWIIFFLILFKSFPIFSGQVNQLMLGFFAGNQYAAYPSPSNDSIATSSPLGQPMDVWGDTEGNIYVMENEAYRISKITPSGIIIAIAGLGTGPGAFTGNGLPATASAFNAANQIWVDTNGNIFVADIINNRIRKITATTGIMTTIAGNSKTIGFNGDHIPAVNATLYQPQGVWGDTLGNIYFTDTYNQRLRMIAVITNIITTLVGNGTHGYNGENILGTFALVYNPNGMCGDTNGNLYYADRSAERVRKLSVAGYVTTIVGGGSSTGQNIPATSAELSGPSDVFVDTLGDIFVADYYYCRILKVTAGTNIMSVIVNEPQNCYGFSGEGVLANLSIAGFPQSVWADTNGRVFYGDRDNRRVRVVVLKHVTTYAGSGLVGDGGPALDAVLFSPVGITGDSVGNLYMTDSCSVRKIIAELGTIEKIAGSLPCTDTGDGGMATSAFIDNPQYVTVDTLGNVYVTNGAPRIRMVTASTMHISTVVGGGGTEYSAMANNSLATSVKFVALVGLWVDVNGNLYFCDSSLYFVLKYSAITKKVTTLAGIGSSGYQGDGGLAISAHLKSPSLIVGNNQGSIFISDSGKIRMIGLSTGIISTVAGTESYSAYNAPYCAIAAELASISALQLDSNGNLYFDDSNNLIRQLLPTTNSSCWHYTVMFGNTKSTSLLEAPTYALSPIGSVSSIWVNKNGTVYIVEPAFHRIRSSFYVSAPTGQPTMQPTGRPSRRPSGQPTGHPTRKPTGQPAQKPSSQPSSRPSRSPSSKPSKSPSSQPTSMPSKCPSSKPTAQPTIRPTSQPFSRPTNAPTRQPTNRPSSRPTMVPSGQPTHHPSSQPTSSPSKAPSDRPTDHPSVHPTSRPSVASSSQPTGQPTGQPTKRPSSQPSSRPSTFPSSKPSTQPSCWPSNAPSAQPTKRPTFLPSSRPTMFPTGQPTNKPSSQPTKSPTSQPTDHPSSQPTSRASKLPTAQPSVWPSSQPTSKPLKSPTAQPTYWPSSQPTSRPSKTPTGRPSKRPSSQPTSRPSKAPSTQPSVSPSTRPTSPPSIIPTRQPTTYPSSLPTKPPSGQPTERPSSPPTGRPSKTPTGQPTQRPSSFPTRLPTAQPTNCPSAQPSPSPSKGPSSRPSRLPTDQPTINPSSHPSRRPSAQPSLQPTCFPTVIPSMQPTTPPSLAPISSPSRRPSSQPSSQPTILPMSHPSFRPTAQPTTFPSAFPTIESSNDPTSNPTDGPIASPTAKPTYQPSKTPSCKPSINPTVQPSGKPSSQPCVSPSNFPSSWPSVLPTTFPSNEPTNIPSNLPTSQPTLTPTDIATHSPVSFPTSNPTTAPSAKPSDYPQPSSKPSDKPTSQPCSVPTSNLSNHSNTTPNSFSSKKPNTSNPSSHSPSVFPSFFSSVTPSIFPTYFHYNNGSIPFNSSVYVKLQNKESFSIQIFLFSSIKMQDTAWANISSAGLQLVGSNYVVYGKKGGYRNSTIDLSSPDEINTEFAELPSSGVECESNSRAASMLGDVNRDGYNDVGIGSPLQDKVFVLFAREAPDFNSGFTLYGESTGDYFGWSIAGAGDFNDDGYDDIIIGAIIRSAVYLIYGKGKGFKNLYMTQLVSTDGLKIIGNGATSLLGVAVSSAGDFNGDGIDDVMFSSQGTLGADVIYVLFGLNRLNANATVVLDELNSSQRIDIVSSVNSFAGLSIASVGDINVDGYDDVVIGSVPYEAGYATQMSYVVYGGNEGRTRVSSIHVGMNMSDEEGLRIVGGGFMVGGPGDVDGDGIDDVLITKYQDWPNQIGDYILQMPIKYSVSKKPTVMPTSSPTKITGQPSNLPTSQPTEAEPRTRSPSFMKTLKPTHFPSFSPSLKPTRTPTMLPTIRPTINPSLLPTKTPSLKPTHIPTRSPTLNLHPTSTPSISPTISLSQPIITYFVNAAGNISRNSSSSGQAKRSAPREYLITSNVDIILNSSRFGRNIYSIFSRPNMTITIYGFQLKEDIIDFTHYTPAITTINELSYSTSPLTLLLAHHQSIIFPDISTFDLTERDFIWSSSSSSNNNDDDGDGNNPSAETSSTTNSLFSSNVITTIGVFGGLLVVSICLLQLKDYLGDWLEQVKEIKRLARNYPPLQQRISTEKDQESSEVDYEIDDDAELGSDDDESDNANFVDDDRSVNEYEPDNISSKNIRAQELDLSFAQTKRKRSWKIKRIANQQANLQDNPIMTSRMIGQYLTTIKASNDSFSEDLSSNSSSLQSKERGSSSSLSFSFASTEFNSLHSSSDEEDSQIM